MDFVGLLAKAMACNGHQCRWRMGQLRDLAFAKPDKVYEMRQRKPTFHELSLKFVCSSDSSIYDYFMYIILSLLSKLYIRIGPLVLVNLVCPPSFRSLLRPLAIPHSLTSKNVIHAIILQEVVAIAPAVKGGK